VIGLPLVAVWRYEPDETATVIGAWSDHPHPFRAGTRWPLDGPGICAHVQKTGRSARIEDFTDVAGTIADAARRTGIRACAGAPIIVDGAVWGAMSTDSTERTPLPDDIEDRLAEFTELVATAISNTASRDELARLADEQAALRRVGHAGRPRRPAARRVRGGRTRGRPAPGCRRHAYGAVRARRDRNWGSRLEPGPRSGPGRHTSPSRRGECRRAGLANAAPRPDTQLRGCLRPCGGTGPEAGSPFVGGRPDRRRPAPLGRDDRLLEARPTAPEGHRVENRRLHGARRHCDLEQRGASRGAFPRGRADRAAARGHAGRA
jgi:GAF domain